MSVCPNVWRPERGREKDTKRQKRETDKNKEGESKEDGVRQDRVLLRRKDVSTDRQTDRGRHMTPRGRQQKMDKKGQSK